jgi:hypothetical protein
LAAAWRVRWSDEAKVGAKEPDAVTQPSRCCCEPGSCAAEGGASVRVGRWRAFEDDQRCERERDGARAQAFARTPRAGDAMRRGATYRRLADAPAAAAVRAVWAGGRGGVDAA